MKKHPSALTERELPKTPGRHAVGFGVYLQIKSETQKSWVFRYSRGTMSGTIGLGSRQEVALSKAREEGRRLRTMLAEGIDPLQTRRDSKLLATVAKAKATTFKECATRYIAAHEASWRSPIHRKQWGSTLEAYVYPHFGSLPVGEIDTGLVLKALESIWNDKPETAGRVRGRIEAILDWAKVAGYRTGENPARWKGHLDHMLPSRRKLRKVEHHAALPYEQLPTFMADVRSREGLGARALEFAILTAGRTGEIIGAEWREIDLAGKLWTVPAERMKGGREHRVPLSDAAMALLEALPRSGKYVFPGSSGRKPLSNMTLLATLKRMGREDLTTHGFRSTFRDWAGDRTAFPRDIIEAALAHALDDATEAAYRRSDALEKRRKLMTAWAGYCVQPARKGEVVELRGARV